MTTSSEQRRAYAGPTIFSHGFRPFFLFAGVWAALAMVLWVGFLASDTRIPSRLLGADWHMHEMLFGYSSAVIAGFLLTAIPNWTGRLPVTGWPVAALAGLWVAGRLTILTGEYLPAGLAAIIDSSFLLVFGLVIAREIIAGKNWRNLKILVLVGLLGAANILFHIEAANGVAFGGYGARMAVGVIIMLISVIGGRVIPSFTRNWLKRQNPGRLPTAMNRFDRITLTVTAASLVIWVIIPANGLTQLLATLTAFLHLARLSRWAGWRCWSEPLVTILHAGYIFIPVGFLAIGLVDILPGLSRASQIPHGWTAGAVGVMTLAMMTRASLGHSGRAITATISIKIIYGSIVLAAVFRIIAEILPRPENLLYASAIFWILGFGLYSVAFFPILTKPRI